jgi:hypothetical protein
MLEVTLLRANRYQGKVWFVLLTDLSQIGATCTPSFHCVLINPFTKGLPLFGMPQRATCHTEADKCSTVFLCVVGPDFRGGRNRDAKAQ